MKLTFRLCARHACSFAATCLLLALVAAGQAHGPFPAEAEVHFDQKLQTWDGFGVNYVETSSTRDYKKTPQEYGIPNQSMITFFAKQ